MHHKANNPEGWYGSIEKSWYAELAAALRPAAEILIIGNGHGHSNGMLQFTKYLAKHDHELMNGSSARSVRQRGPHRGEILALARQFYGDAPPRDHGDGRWGEN